MRPHWLVEVDAFGERGDELLHAAMARGHRATPWEDGWWESGAFPVRPGERVVFHGSLGNAARIRSETSWEPGAYCHVEAFLCSGWYAAAARWLLTREHVFTTVGALAEAPREVTSSLGRPEQVFVRPDSPLKPFSGRVLAVGELSLEALDFGFYYEDPALPVVVSRVEEVGEECRFVVVDRRMVASSAYVAEGRGAAGAVDSEFARLAAEVAAELPPPEPIYVLDLVRTPDGPRLLELNPFSGADLYGCDRGAIVAAVAEHLRRA